MTLYQVKSDTSQQVSQTGAGQNVSTESTKPIASFAESTLSRQQTTEEAFTANVESPALLKPHQVKPGANPFFVDIGIVGGMGPQAGVDLAAAVSQEALQRLPPDQRKDQNAPGLTLQSRASGIQDRTAYLVNNKVPDLSPDEKLRVLKADHPENPLPGMLDSIQRLQQDGAKVYGVACNTAHAWAPFFRDAAKDMRHVHIVDSALSEALESPPVRAKVESGETAKIGLLATTGTVDNRIYHDRLAELAKFDPRYAQIELVVPDQHVQKGQVMAGIYDGVKGNNLELGRKHLTAAAHHLIKDKQADALALACTEIPLVLNQQQFPDTAVIDANRALARGLVDASIKLRQEESETQTSGTASAESQVIGQLPKMLTLDDLRPGDILIQWEAYASRPNRADTMRIQNAPHNGLTQEENVGDFRNVHAVIWVGNPGNPRNTGPNQPNEPEVVEARAGLDLPSPIMRIHGTSLQSSGAGTFRVYRPTDPNLGDWAAQVAMFMAQGNVEYSKKDLSAIKRDDPFDAEAKARAAEYAKDAFNPSPEWAKNPENAAPKYRDGGVCSTILLKIYQAAQLNIMAAKKQEETGEAVCEFDTDGLTGFMAHNANVLSPRTLEHLAKTGKNADGTPQFEFIGEVKHEQRTYPEAPFGFPPVQLPKLPVSDARSTEYGQSQVKSKL